MGRYNNYDEGWPRYVPVAERRRRALKTLIKMRKGGSEISPVEISGRKIAKTFWGEGWCKNLEAYSDYANRLPRGRTYVRNGSVLDLRIKAGRVHARVSGTELYTVDIKIKALPEKKWTEIKGRCAGQIGSLVELLQGAISKRVMKIVTCKGDGLFPSPQEIELSCSCPDWATMCKHVAAVLYGVGARLDHGPELLFTLRGIDPAEIVESAIEQPPAAGKAGKGRRLDAGALSSVFGVDIDIEGLSDEESSTPVKPARRRSKKATPRKVAATKGRKKPVAKKPVAKKPAAKKPAAKKPAAKNPVAKKPAAKNPVAKNPVAKKPAAKNPVAKKPAAKKPVAKKPVAKKPGKKSVANPARTKIAAKASRTLKTTKKPEG